MQYHCVHMAIPGKFLAAEFDIRLVHAQAGILLIVGFGALEHQVDGFAASRVYCQGGDQGLIFIQDGEFGGGKSCGHGVLSFWDQWRHHNANGACPPRMARYNRPNQPWRPSCPTIPSTPPCWKHRTSPPTSTCAWPLA